MPATRKPQGKPPASIAAPLIVLAACGGAIAIYHGYPGLVLVWLGVLVAAWSEPLPQFSGPKDSYGAPTPLGAGEHRAKKRFATMRQLRSKLLVPDREWVPGPLTFPPLPETKPAWVKALRGTVRSVLCVLGPPNAAWLLAVSAGVLAYAIPVAEPSWAANAAVWDRVGPAWPWANSVAAFVLVLQVPAARRISADPSDPRPAVNTYDLGQTEHIRPVVFGGLAVFAAVSLGCGVVLSRQPWGFSVPGPPIIFGAAIALVVTIGIIWAPWKKAALAQWEERTEARADWEPRWEVALGKTDKTGSPRMVGRRIVGALVVDTFEAPAAVGAAGLVAARAKLATAVGGGQAVAVLPCPNTDSDGRPMPGTTHPLRVEVVTYPADEPPDVCDPDMGAEEAAYAISTALALAVEAFGGGGAQYVLADIQPLHTRTEPEPEPTGWGRLLARAGETDAGQEQHNRANETGDGEDDQQAPVPDGGASGEASAGAVWMLAYGGANELSFIRSSYAPMMSAHLAGGAVVLVNDWPEGDPLHPGANRVYVGAIGAEGTVLEDSSAGEMLEQLALDDQWRDRWSGVLKTGANPPDPQFNVADEGQVGRSTVHYLPFLVRQGDRIDDFEKLEPKLATTLLASPFVSVTGYPGRGGRPGDRHPQAFTVCWSDGPVPESADRLAPPRGRVMTTQAGTPHQWVLAGQVNAAFDHARLPRPEVFSARALTRPGTSRGHVWQVEMRLHGGVSLPQVREKMARIASSLGVPWLQVAPSDKPQCMVLVLGADFRKADLANPQKDMAYLADLEWQQAWVDAKLVNSSGLTPTTLATSPLPHNEKVFCLDFELPSGITISRVKGAVEKLKGSTRNHFIDVRPGAYGANSVRLLVCAEDPMPFPAPADFDYVHDPGHSRLLPFATGVEGQPVSIDLETSAHLLVVGGTGSGKSASLQMLLYSMLHHGWDVHVADPMKGAADFAFASPWLSSITTTTEETSAMMDAVMAEVDRRKSLNSKYGVGSYTELPEQVRPNHTVIVIDEFTSLILADKPKKPASQTQEALAEYAEALERASLVENIGAKVGRVSREARSAGVMLVLATQQLTADDLKNIPGGKSIRTNMARMILGKTTFGERQSALRSPESAPDLGDEVPKGRGLLETSGEAIRIVQSWYDHPIQEVLATGLREQGVAEADKIDLAPFMPDREPVAVEGAILSVDEPGEPGGDEEIDLGELDFSDLTLDEPAEDEAVTPDASVARVEPEQQVEAPEGAPVITGDAAAADLGEIVAWTGPAGQAPEGAMVVSLPPEQEALLGHPLLDGLGQFLDQQAPSELIWATSAATQADETGERLDDAARALASTYGTALTVVPLEAEQAACDDPAPGFEGQEVSEAGAVDSNQEDFDFRPTGADTPETPKAAVSAGHILSDNEEEFDF